MILAGEPMGSGAQANSLLEDASRLIPGHPDLKRVTILAARPDATVLVQADYYSRGAAPAARPITGQALTVSQSSLSTATRISALSSHLSPLQFYMRTQQGFDDLRRPALLDVLA